MSPICETCRQPDAETECELCKNALCEDCVLSPPKDAFRLMSSRPPELELTSYCRFCYDDKVEPALVQYEANRERARNVFVFFKTQRKEIPLIKKSKTTHKVTDCDDRDETILRLAYIAASEGFNALIETDVAYEKKRDHAYQTTVWSGTGSPAQIDEQKLDRQFKQNQIYR